MVYISLVLLHLSILFNSAGGDMNTYIARISYNNIVLCIWYIKAEYKVFAHRELLKTIGDGYTIEFI